MNFSTETLELHKILLLLSHNSFLNVTKEHFLNLKPMIEQNEIIKVLNETEEMRQIYVAYGEIPFGRIKDLSSTLDKLHKEAILNIFELSMIKNFIDGTNQITLYKRTITKVILNYLKDYFVFNDLKDLYKTIDNCIDDNEQVKDNASNDLKKIRTHIKIEEARLKEKLNEIISKNGNMLSDTNIVLRNNRLCLAVKNDYKNSFKGIIHDESNTKTTIYIEPLATYEINMRILNLYQEEKNEIEKILFHLSSLTLDKFNELNLNFTNVIKLDFVNAKAKFAIDYNCICPKINQNKIIQLVDAKHPLLDLKNVVPLSLDFGDKYHVIVITGPNTGGKTVALKTVGLLSLMTQTGLLIPAKEANMHIFDNIFADIGDEQSIEQSLSTFSSHMHKIINITKSINDNSLILLDELGGGTDPQEGTSLAIALLNYFKAKDSRVMITTHYSELKAYAYESDKTINASMEFDLKTLKPTYRLLVGISGKSNAFEISRRLGLAENIIHEAKQYLLSNTNEANLLLKKIEDRGYELENEIKKYQNINRDLEEQKKLIDSKNRFFIENEQKILKKASDKAEKYLEEKTIEANELIDEIKHYFKEKPKEHEIATLKGKINALNPKEINVDINHSFKEGDYVNIITYDCIGKIVRIKDDKYIVKFGNLEAPFNRNELLPSYDEPKINKPKIEREKIQLTSIKDTLDLRGMRYEEALMAIEKFIDQAMYANLSSITIIHGFGTGALRKATNEYLKNCKYIKNYRFGQSGEGLNGVTIAYLK